MAAARWCSHRGGGGWKVDFRAARESGKMLAGSGSGGVGSCHRCSWWCGCFVAADGKYGAKYGKKTSSFSTPNRGGFASYLLSVFFADAS